MTQKLKTAVLLTGAAARISQEVAMLDKLIADKGLILSQNETLLAGFSSGSLNLAAINACFSEGSKLDWNSYYKEQVLFQLRNSDVYRIKKLPFDTDPLRDTILNFIDKMNCYWMGNLAFHSYILTFSWEELQTMWACSRNPEQEYINLADMFMSSTAIPLLFPAQEIRFESGKQMDFPVGKFADGGTGGTFKRFENYIGEYVKQNGQFDDLFIISPMREKEESEHKEILSQAKSKIIKGFDLNDLIDYLKNISMSTFMKFLQKLNDWSFEGEPIAKNIYVSIPEMKKNFPIINFNKQEKQYFAVMDWAKENPDKVAIPLKEFLDKHIDLIEY